MAISVSGLSAQRTRMEAIASNLANARRRARRKAAPYRRRIPVFRVETGLRPTPEQQGQRSSRVDRIVLDDAAPLMRYEPGHPDADADGRVAYPNVDPVREMVDMLSATRSYEANVTVLKSVRAMWPRRSTSCADGGEHGTDSHDRRRHPVGL